MMYDMFDKVFTSKTTFEEGMTPGFGVAPTKDKNARPVIQEFHAAVFARAARFKDGADEGTFNEWVAAKRAEFGDWLKSISRQSRTLIVRREFSVDYDRDFETMQVLAKVSFRGSVDGPPRENLYSVIAEGDYHGTSESHHHRTASAG